MRRARSDADGAGPSGAVARDPGSKTNSRRRSGCAATGRKIRAEESRRPVVFPEFSQAWHLHLEPAFCIRIRPLRTAEEQSICIGTEKLPPHPSKLERAEAAGFQCPYILTVLRQFVV